jgi:hypothetical protein
MKYFIFATLLMLVSCLNNDLSPEAALQDFVNSRVGQVIDRQFVLDRVTGKMLQSFENMSDEDFIKFSDMKNIKADSFKILSKSCQDKKCFITYSISYFTKNEEKNQYATEVKKIAELNLVDKKWLIGDVTNIKTYHENMEPINPLE